MTKKQIVPIYKKKKPQSWPKKEVINLFLNTLKMNANKIIKSSGKYFKFFGFTRES